MAFYFNCLLYNVPRQQEESKLYIVRHIYTPLDNRDTLADSSVLKLLWCMRHASSCGFPIYYVSLVASRVTIHGDLWSPFNKTLCVELIGQHATANPVQFMLF